MALVKWSTERDLYGINEWLAGCQKEGETETGEAYAAYVAWRGTDMPARRRSVMNWLRALGFVFRSSNSRRLIVGLSVRNNS